MKNTVDEYYLVTSVCYTLCFTNSTRWVMGVKELLVVIIKKIQISYKKQLHSNNILVKYCIL